MCCAQKDPLRELRQEECKILEQFSRFLMMPADQVIHAKEVLAVADGHTFTNAAKFAGRKSSDAVAYPPDCTFQCQKTPALEMHHEGGPPILYNQAECERILRDVRRLD